MVGTRLRLKKRKDSKSQLKKLIEKPEDVVIIHYSCESFYDRPDGKSPRITSIAVRNFASGQTESFSIHQMAERDGILNFKEINAKYDKLEETMLKEFYQYAEKHDSCIWLHWNMRDMNYGFAALEHRFKVLGGESFNIHEKFRIDLNRLLVALYGIRYIGHPRIARLVEKNEISDIGFLTGKDEAEAFENGEYVKLHQSTLRKVDIFANIAERTINGTLKTNATIKDKYGGCFGFIFENVREHLIISIVGFFGSIASIIGLIWMAIKN
jgi:hypothetical protein